MTKTELTWPNGKRIAIAVSVMFETWAEGKSPTYSVQTTHLKAPLQRCRTTLPRPPSRAPGYRREFFRR
jgi:hypothetical protein